MRTISGRLLEIYNILQRIIINYASPDSLSSTARLSLSRMETGSISDGQIHYILKRNGIDSENVENIYRTTIYEYIPTTDIVDNSDPSTTVTIVISDLNVAAEYKLDDKMLICLPMRVIAPEVDEDKETMYYYIFDLAMGIYYDIEKSLSDSKSTYQDGEIEFMRALLVAYGFLNSVYTSDLRFISGLIHQHSSTYTRFHNFVNLKSWDINILEAAIVETIIDQPGVEVDDTPSKRIKALLVPFDGCDIDYWIKLTDNVIRINEKEAQKIDKLFSDYEENSDEDSQS